MGEPMGYPKVNHGVRHGALHRLTDDRRHGLIMGIPGHAPFPVGRTVSVAAMLDEKRHDTLHEVHHGMMHHRRGIPMMNPMGITVAVFQYNPADTLRSWTIS